MSESQEKISIKEISAAKRFLLSLAPGFGPVLKTDEKREGALALVEIFRAGQVEPFEREFLAYFDKEVTRLQKQGELRGIQEDIIRFLLDPSPEGIRDTLHAIFQKALIPATETEVEDLAKQISNILITGNEMVITRAAVKQLEELMRLDPKVMKEAIARVSEQVQAVVSQFKVSPGKPRFIIPNAATGWTDEVFNSFPKYLGLGDRGFNAQIIVMIAADRTESLGRREEIQKINQELGKKYPGYRIEFVSATASSQEKEILRLYLGVPAAVIFSVLGQELKAKVNQTLRPTGIPIKDLDQAIDDLLALVATTLILMGNPSKSAEASLAVAKLKTQLADYGIYIQQGEAGNWTVTLRLEDLTRHLGLEAQAIQARLAAA